MVARMLNRRQPLKARLCQVVPRPALQRNGRVPAWFRWCQLLCVAVTLFMVQGFATPVVFAQATASFFNQVGVATDTTAADACMTSFSSALTGQGLVSRPSTEVASMVRECVEDLANPDFARQCDLRAAVGQVDYVMVYHVSREGEEWYFRVEALSPLQQGTVWQQGTLVAESSAVRGAMTGCSELAQDFLVRQSFVENEPSEGGRPVEALPAVVEVVSVTPSPVAVYVNGEEAGVAPGQFDVPASEPVQFELRSPGFTPFAQMVEVPAGGLETFRDVSLTPLPGTIEVTANVQGGEVYVNGTLVATTVRNRVVPVEVSPGRHAVEVRREGYAVFGSEVQVAPGAVVAVAAELAPVVEEPVVVQPTPELDPQPIDVLQRPVDPAPRATCTVRRLSGALLTGLGLGLAGYGAYLNNAAQITRSPGEPWEEQVVSSERRIGGISLMVGGASVSGVGLWQAARRCR
jgi:hypothetical protein